MVRPRRRHALLGYLVLVVVPVLLAIGVLAGESTGSVGQRVTYPVTRWPAGPQPAQEHRAARPGGPHTEI